MDRVRNIDLQLDSPLSTRDIITGSEASSIDVNHVTGEYVVTHAFHCTGYMGGSVILHSQSPDSGLVGLSDSISMVFESIPEHSVLSYPLDTKIDYANGDMWIADTGNNRLIKVDLNTKNVVATSENICVFPTCVVPNVNTGGAFVRGYDDMETSVVKYVDETGSERLTFSFYGDMPVESIGGEWFAGSVIITDANGDYSRISRISVNGDVVDYSNVESNPQYASISHFSGDACIVYEGVGGNDIVEYRFPDGSTRGSINRTGSSGVSPAMDHFSRDVWVTSYVEDFDEDLVEKIRFGVQDETSYSVGFTPRIDGVIDTCFSSLTRRLYVLHNEGKTLSVYGVNGHQQLGTIDLSLYGKFKNPKENTVNGDVWLLREDGKMFLRVTDYAIEGSLLLENTVYDFAIESYVRLSEMKLYALSQDGINYCVYQITYLPSSWGIIGKAIIPEDDYRHIVIDQSRSRLWFASNYNVYWMDWNGELSEANQVNGVWSDITSLSCFNYLSSYFLGLPYHTESNMPIVSNMCYDHVRDRLWWLSRPKVYMVDLKNKQVITQDMSSYGCIAMFGIDVEYATGNAFFSITSSVSRHYVMQVSLDNTEVLATTYLPQRIVHYGETE